MAQEPDGHILHGGWTPPLHLPSLAIAIGALLDVGMLKFGILLDADGPFAYLPFIAGVAIAAIMIIWWLLGYATTIRAEMGAIDEIE